MTRKDYEIIAKALARTRPEPYGPLYPATDGVARFGTSLIRWKMVRSEIAHALAADNPRFNRDTFFAATESPLLSARPST